MILMESLFYSSHLNIVGILPTDVAYTTDDHDAVF